MTEMYRAPKAVVNELGIDFKPLTLEEVVQLRSMIKGAQGIEWAERIIAQVAQRAAMLAKESKPMAQKRDMIAGEVPNLPEELTELLADVVNFYFRSHGAHWNVKGSDFSEYHALFNEIYEDVYGSIDPLAENLRKLGALAPFHLADFIALTELQDASVGQDPMALARDLLSANAIVLDQISDAFDCATMCGQQGIANFLAERMDKHQFWNWQLTASLGEEVVTPEPDVMTDGTDADDVEEQGERKASGQSDLPLADRGVAWDASAAEKNVRAWAGGDKIDWSKYAKAFFYVDQTAPDKFGSYKLQFADVSGGQLRAIPRGIFAVAGVLAGARGGVDIPESDKTEIKAKVSAYYDRMANEFDDKELVAPFERSTDASIREERKSAMAKAERFEMSTEIRAMDTEDGALRIGGYAAQFNKEATGLSFREIIAPGAFKRTLQSGEPVYLLVNHDTNGIPLASTAGGTLNLSEDETGLRMEADLDPANPKAQELYSAISRGDIGKMSFAFTVAKDGSTRKDGLRTLSDVNLFEVSAVTWPAYQDTAIGLRTAEEAPEEDLELRKRLLELKLKFNK